MSPPTAEAVLIAYLNAALDGGVECFGDVPAKRPDVFVTVERTGGPKDLIRDQGLYAVGCWHTSRARAAALADRVAGLLAIAPAHISRIGATGVQSIYNLPDPDSGQARYQITVTATVYEH